MKKILLFTLIIVMFVVSISGCNWNAYYDHSYDDDLFKPKTDYDYGFSEYYTEEEYEELLVELRERFDDESISTVYAVNKGVMFIMKTIDTYNKYEEQIALVNLNNNTVSSWRTEWSKDDIREKAICGDYFFVHCCKTCYAYADHRRDVINKNGRIIATIECPLNRYDIGMGYVFFAMNKRGYIMSPTGRVYELQSASVTMSIGGVDEELNEEDEDVGNVSYGMFYVYKKGNINTVAYYYNLQGEVVIDLSTTVVDYTITKLYDFSNNGTARIEFRGANYKDYYAYINEKGEFVQEPVEMRK